MQKTVSIRKFRQRDLDAILKIEHACFGKDAYDRNLFAEYAHMCGGLFLVAERLGRICGYMLACVGSKGGSHRAELVSVAVDPGTRGQGVASALMDSTLRCLRRRRAKCFWLMVKVTNRRALAFYKKYDFKPRRIARRYYEDGKDAWIMSKDLP